MKTVRKRNETIDVMRILASFMVVLIHIHLPEPVTGLSMALGRFAVPFFFMVSGYYMRREDDGKTLEAAWRFFLSVLKMTGLSVLAVSVINVAVSLIRGSAPFGWLTSFFARDGLRLLLLYNRSHFLNSAMWYLLALVYAMVIILALLKLRVMRRAYWTIVPLLVWNLIRGEGMGMPWYTQGNWLFMALPFLMLGMVLRDTGWARKIPAPAAWCMIAAGIASTCVEGPRFGEQVLYMGTVPVALGVIILCLQNEDRDWPDSVAEFGRRLTPWIFVLHCSLRDLVYACFGRPKDWTAVLMPFLFFLLSAMVAAAFRRLWCMIRRRQGA